MRTGHPERQKRSIPGALRLRPLACCSAAFSGAVFLTVYVLTGVKALLLGGLLLFCGLALLLRRHRLAGAMVLLAAVGCWLVWLWSWRIWTLNLNWQDTAQSLTMQVQDYPTPTSTGCEVQVRCTTGPLQGVRLRLYLSRRDTDAKPGDLLTGEVALSCAEGQPGPWRYYNYAAGALLVGNAHDLTVHSRPVPLHLLPREAAHRLALSLQSCFDGDTAGFLLALTIGDRSGLSSELEQALSNTGLRHIVAASGLHVTILITAAAALLPGSGRRKCVLLLPLLLGYAALAGFTPSICRAVVMEGLFLLAPALGRESDPPTSLLLALALLLLQNPYAAASLSLQLSFACMSGILFLVPDYVPDPERPFTLPVRLRKAVGTSLAVSLGTSCLTLPLVLYAFGSASCLFPLSNLAVLWILPFLLPLAMLTAAVGLLSPLLAAPLALVTALPVKALMALILSLNRLPHPTLYDTPQTYLALAVALTVAVLLRLDVLRPPVRSGVLVLLCLALLLVLLPDGSIASVRVLDVGQGQCILLLSQNRTAVIDCGSLQNRAGSVLTNTLHRLGRQDIDTLIFTHYDSDHTNGTEYLLRRCRVRQVLVPAPEDVDRDKAQALLSLLRQYGAEIVTVTPAGYDLCVGSLELHTLDVGQGDNSGLVILATAGSFDLLVTGDLDMDGEGALLSSESLPDIELLVAGHHGSAGSTGEALLSAVTPEAVVCSVGPNPYGHPTSQAMDRCVSAGARLWRTDEDGTVTVRVYDREEDNFRMALAK